jgi:cyclic lactone autoinducer peptide
MKGKEKLRKKVLKVVERVARNEVEKNMFTWPPICLGIYHQPKRPQNKEK